MKIVGAYLLAVLGGNNTPSSHDIKAILSSVGIEAEDDRIELLLSQVEGKDLADIISSGREKLASLPTANGAVSAAVTAPTTRGGDVSAAGADAVPAESKKTEKEMFEESDDDMCFTLFD